MYFLTVLFFLGLDVVQSDLFSGTDGIKCLSVAEDLVVDDLDTARRQLEGNIHQMKQIVQDIKRKSQEKLDELEQQGNPISMYHMIKRWRQLIQLFHLEEALVTVDPDCHDDNAACVQWAANGDCHNNSNYMRTYCQKSCGVCVKDARGSEKSDCRDNNKHCAPWAKRGECEKNPDYMLVYCKKSCNECPSPQSECQDTSPYCAFWAADNQCETNAEYMALACRKSCSLCEKRNILFSEIVQKLDNLTNGKTPTADDYKGAAQGLIRLQRTYKLTTADVLLGNITGLMSAQPLTTEELYYIGKVAIHDNEWGYGLQWLQQALARSNKDSSFVTEVRLQMAKAYVKMKDTYRAESVMVDLLQEIKLDIDNICYDKDEHCAEKAKECEINSIYMQMNCQFTCNVCSGESDHCFDHRDECPYWEQNGECTKSTPYMEKYCRYSCKLCPDEQIAEMLTLNISMRRQPKNIQSSKSYPEPNTLREEEVAGFDELYENLCDGKSVIRYHNAVCRYRHALLPYYLYKEEILSMNPRISMVYDVINDKEAEDIKSLAKARMTRGLVGFDAQASVARVSNVGWLEDSSSELVERITNRIEMITGLEMSDSQVIDGTKYESSDSLQIVNYGIGGHYKPHTDYFEIDDTPESKNSSIAQKIQTSGDRIATFLMYLSHVQAGGATVFPEMKIRVPPFKNAAAFWYNSKLSGEYDSLTLHAGCPVLMGEKWVANKWVREYGNTFKRRCGLSENAEYE